MTSLLIPDEEFLNRWRSLQEEMAKKNLDLLFVYSDDHKVFGPANVRYLSDFFAHFESVAVILTPSGEPILVTGPECNEYARITSRIKDIRTIEEFAVPEEDYPFTKMTSLSEIIREIEAVRKEKITNIGVVGFDLMSYCVYRKVLASFGKRKITDAADLLIRLRSIKSEREIQIIQAGYKIADAGMKACLDKLQVGAREFEIAAAGEYAMRKAGAEGTAIDSIVASGKKNTYPILSRPTARSICQNDLVVITIGPRISGYNPAIGRPVVMGKIDKKLLDAMKIALEAQHACEEALVPGAVGKEVEGAARKVLKKAGLEQYFVYAGVHSVGLAEFEPPILSPKSEQIVEPNMVFSIDIPVFLSPWGGFRFEDGFVVTEKGCHRLNEFPREIVKI